MFCKTTQAIGVSRLGSVETHVYPVLFSAVEIVEIDDTNNL